MRVLLIEDEPTTAKAIDTMIAFVIVFLVESGIVG